MWADAADGQAGPGDASIVVVTGAGRSGTSSLAGSLKRLGLHVPQPEVPAKPSNPKGFYEPQWVIDFHKQHLSTLAMHNIDARPSVVDDLRRIQEDETVRLDLRRWIESHLVHAPLVIKDPHAFWFTTLWKDVAQELGVQMHMLTAVRHPAEVVGSRDLAYLSEQPESLRRIKETSNVAGWVHSGLLTELGGRDISRAFIRYSDLVTDWRTALGRVGEQLHLPFDTDAFSQKHHEIDAFIDVQLQRSRLTWDDLTVSAPLREIGEEVWQLLSGMVDRPYDEASMGRLDEVYRDYERRFTEAVALTYDHTKAEAVLSTRRAVEQKDRRIAELRRKLTRQRARLENASQRSPVDAVVAQVRLAGRAVRSRATKGSSSPRRAGGRAASEDPPPRRPRQRSSMIWKDLGDRSPSEVADETLGLVMTALTDQQLPAFVVRTPSLTRRTVGIYSEHRDAALQALATGLNGQNVYAKGLDGRGNHTHLVHANEVASDAAVRSTPVLRLCRPFATDEQRFRVGFDYACDLEFWEPEGREGARRAPRINVAADVIQAPHRGMASVRIGGQTYPTPQVFTRTMLDDITFPIDVVYAWVDGDDPDWLAKKRLWSERGGDEAKPQVTAVGDRRFKSRDEIRYSLRSLRMYAPWVRKVFIVTDDQVPEWLRTGAEGIEVVSHADLFEGAALPTFNSNVISSYLHRIEGLAEHFVYFNDDVFVGRPLGPQAFFTPAGQARLFPAKARRPFGHPSPKWLPQENVAMNIRRILEAEHGVSLSRAVRHAPVAMLRSEMARLEEAHRDEFDRTRANRFRSDSDIAPGLLFHYHAQVVGCGVAHDVDYQYVNLGDHRELSKMHRLAKRRDRDYFCLNDTVAHAGSPIPDEEVVRFLEGYFPIPSAFEQP